ncbi:MAG: GH3 auxin-responsive promoter family protein, partial [bacterium]|nr:GH3 auxin-responsive promoter family protein [bacterium]
SYEDLSPYLDRMCNGEEDVLVKGKPVIYATTSGTTGKPKFIPVTSSTLKEGHKLIKDIWIYHLGKSKKRFITGKVLAVVSPSTEGHTPDGTPFGSTSGHIYKNIKKIVQNKYVIPSFVMDIEDYNTKYYVILLLALRESRITYISTANPSTILLLCRKMNEWINDLISDIAIGSLKPGLSLSGEERQKVEALLKPHHKRAKRLRHFHTKHGTLRPKEIWPHLAALGCWTGGNAGTFLSEIKPYFNPETEIRELGYLASEMRGSLPISPGSSEGILTINENFFEFVEIEEWNSNEKAGSTRFKMAHEVETGKEYYIFITNNSGLYRYNMNDIVRVTGKYLSTPLITFLQKGKGVTNITGEKLYENQFTSAVEKAKKKLKLPLHFYMGIANTEKCYYEVVAEFNGTTDDSVEKEFIDLVDQYLGKINCEYEAKRKSLRLNKASLEKLPSGSYEKFKTRRVQNGQREGQFKIVSLTSDQAIKNELWDRV